MRGSNKYFCNLEEVESVYFPKALERREIKSRENQANLGAYWAGISLEKAKQKLEEELKAL